jgi:20S proteasome alpha/beta subunit
MAPTPRPIGTTVAVARSDYVVVAAETSIEPVMKPTTTKVIALPNTTTALITSGCRYSVDHVENMLHMRNVVYQAVYQEHMELPTVVKLVSNTIYNQRLANCFDYNILVGIDLYGKGAIFLYDSIGRFKRINSVFLGSDASLAQELLEDEMIISNTTGEPLNLFSKAETVSKLKDIYESIEINPGSGIDVFAISSSDAIALNTTDE